MRTVAQLSHDARTATSLTDFGDESFLEGHEILVRSLGREAHLNTLGH
jgi:hypothetical protein